VTVLYVSPEATEPATGDIFVCDVAGLGGPAIEAGQILDGDPVRWLEWRLGGSRKIDRIFDPPWRFEHAGVYLGGMTVVQAEPGGATTRVLPGFDFAGRVMWSTGCFELTAAQRAMICDAATYCAAQHIGYSVADYAEIAAHRLGLGTAWLRKEIADSGHMICSQLADWCYQEAGYHIFRDNRWNGDVKPSDLAGRFIRQGIVQRRGQTPTPC
jgi:hypothetical protein